jgi:hypothetical protein
MWLDDASSPEEKCASGPRIHVLLHLGDFVRQERSGGIISVVDFSEFQWVYSNDIKLRVNPFQ